MEKSALTQDDFASHTKNATIGLPQTQSLHTPANRSDAAMQSAIAEMEKPRTPGLKLFDFFLYPVLTNLSVIGISIAATYLTARGADKNVAGTLKFGKIGEWFHTRGEWIVNKFKSMGMTHGQADMSKMVFFSFLDGSLMAPVVKLIEDKREDIACYIDHQLGTKPEDLSVYAREPKQTWLSVLGGRFLTAAIVVPTAVALDKTGLNDRWFTKPGIRIGEWLAKKPGIEKWLGALDVKELCRIGLFEAFYTSVCTGGLYVASRYIAKLTGHRQDAQCEPKTGMSGAGSQENCGHAGDEAAIEPKASEAMKRKCPEAKVMRGHAEKYLSAAAAPSLAMGV